MKRKRWLYVAGPIGLALFIFLGGEVVMRLWNWLLPDLFGVRGINFWQALGLLALSRILFGGFGGPRGPRMRRRHKDVPLTPEERDRLHRNLREEA
jgi:hypothetical protein